MTREAGRRGLFWLGVAAALTAAKLWLTRGQPVYALALAAHDDRLFLDLAGHLLDGQWLGPYSQMTLAKGPAYPLWIALMHVLGVPLFLGQHLAYAAACALLARAVRPALPSAGARCALYLLLLWNPMTFEAGSLGRVLRQHLTVTEVVLVFAGLLALLLRREGTFRRLLPWSTLLGGSLAAFYLTREDTIWLAPGIALLAGAWLVSAWRDGAGSRRTAVRALAWAAFVATLPVLAVCTLNHRHYGWFGTVEFRAPEFKAAYGALLRVKAGPARAYVPVNREAREAAYAVSPALARIRPWLEGDIGRNWSDASVGLTGIPATERQLGGGWFMWALRDAVAASGAAPDARAAVRYYRQVAVEINRACDERRVEALPGRSGFMPPWQEGQPARVAATLWEFARYTAAFDDFTARAPASEGGPEDLLLFRRLTGELVSPPPGGQDWAPGASQYMLNARRVEWLNSTGRAVRAPLGWLLALAHIVLLVRLAQAVVARQAPASLVAAVAASGTALASLGMQAAVHVTSFPVKVISSFAPAYLLWLLTLGFVAWDAWSAWTSPAEVARPVRPEPVATPAPAGALAWLLGLAALAPFLIWHRQFAELVWFGDEFMLVDQIAQMGFWTWCGRVFSENFVPLFKVLWGGGVLAFGGSYLAMLVLLWLTHALNTALLGRLLRRAGMSAATAGAVQVVFALTPANLETLGWTVQWSAVLAVTFLLLGLLWIERYPSEGGPWHWRVHGPLLLAAAASACSFSRGVLTGGVLALSFLLPAAFAGRPGRWIDRGRVAALCLLPAVVVALVIAGQSSGNHLAMAGHFGEAARFGATFFLLQPFYLLAGEPSLAPAMTILLGGGKAVLVAAGLLLARGRSRHLLLVLLAYDLGNSALLGVGRYHTGALAALSSRYAYSSLLATLPFVALAAARGAEFLGRGRSRRLAYVLLPVLAAWCLAGWPRDLATFVPWRGTEIRRALSAPPTSDPDAKLPYLDFMHVERAKAVQRAFNLH